MKILGYYLNIGQKSCLLQFIQFAIQNHRPISDDVVCAKSNNAVNMTIEHTRYSSSTGVTVTHKIHSQIIIVGYILDSFSYLNALHSH
jgi:hypothetical protein